MFNLPSIVVRYWQLLRTPGRVATGVVGIFFFMGGIIFWGGFNWSMEATNTEAFCSSCHAPIVEEIRETIHYSNRSGVRAICSDCHVPHEWTAKIVRKVQASKELVAYALGTINTPEKFQARRGYLANREWKRLHKNDSLECRNCHDQVFMNFDDQQAPGVFMHSVMMKDGAFTCIDCHKGIAHKLPALTDFDEISPDTLEPTMRPPYDHTKTTLEQY